MGGIDPIRKLLSTTPFVADTVVGPYVCRWTWADGRPAILFLGPYDGEAAPVVAGSPNAMSPPSVEARVE